MGKYICYSVWGDKPMYTIGAVKNSNLRKTLFPDWQSVFFYDSSVPEDIIKQLSDNGDLLIKKEDNKLFSGLFWRYSLIFDPQYRNSIFLFRDTDSRIFERDQNLVRDWFELGKTVCCSRDHKAHKITLMGGACGIDLSKVKDSDLEIAKKEFLKYSKDNFLYEYGDDEWFLNNCLLGKLFKTEDTFAYLCDESLRKSSCDVVVPIPKDNPYAFIGNKYTETDLAYCLSLQGDTKC